MDFIPPFIMKKYYYIFSITIFFILAGCSNKTTGYFERGYVSKPKSHQNIDFDFSKGLILIPVKIEGEIYTFIFDTGAPLVISQGLEEKLKLKKVSEGKVTDTHNQQSSLNFVTIPELQIASFIFRDYIAISADFSKSIELECLGIDGIIGANLMKSLYWKIDFEKLKLGINYNPWHDINENDLVVPFKTKPSYTPVIDIQIDTIKIEGATFDTGSSGFFSMGDAGIPKKWLNTYSKKRYGYTSSGLFGSIVDTVLSKEAHLKIFDYTGHHTITIRKGNNKNLLGLKFMQNFNVYLDFKQNQITLKRKKDISQYIGDFGFSPKMQNDSTLIVAALTEGSEAENKGIKIGDEIAYIQAGELDSRKSKDLCNFLLLLAKLKPNRIIVRLKNNSQTFDFEKTKL